MTDVETVTLHAELTDATADREITKAVKGRRSLARAYVRWVRRGNPEASPDELITALGRQYTTAITVAGGLVTAGAIAIDVGIALIPIAGAAAVGAKTAAREGAKKATKEATKLATKEAAKAATKAAAKGFALDASKRGAQHVANMLPAGDEQLQFEITALYALALAEIHDMDLDPDQMRALVYGLTNGRVASRQIAQMAADLAQSRQATDVGREIASGREDWSHWAETLAHSLPAGAAQELVRGVQTGQLENVRSGLGKNQQAAVEYGVGAIVGGLTRFVFGREVLGSAKEAFPDAPHEFPDHLVVALKDKSDDEPNRAFLALQDAARSTGGWVGDSAHAVGVGVGNAAEAVSRPFRSVDLDGDGIPDEAQALTAVNRLIAFQGVARV